MTPEEFVKNEIISGRLTFAEIVELTRYFQIHEKMLVDGKPGDVTQAALDKIMDARVGPVPTTSRRFLSSPMPILADGRKATITSEFRTKDRPTHNGLDYFYSWKKGDKPDFAGDGGAEGKTKTGEPKWVVPYDVPALAAAEGIVQVAGNSPTGYRIFIDHGNGLRSGYFHLMGLRVSVGQAVSRGQQLGPIGHNPADTDGRHLHFEISPTDRYAPLDPADYLR